MAEIGKTSAGNKADIAGADHGNAHVKSIVKVTNRLRSMPDRACIPEATPQWREAPADAHFLWPNILAD
ncbi:MAG: hypothetical protein WAZ97_06815 [Pseudolabrys sp.]|jgi:hypothetical protein